MELIPIIPQEKAIVNGVEVVQKQKQEYYLLGTFLRKSGLKLFGYNHFEDKVIEVQIKYSNTIHIIPRDGVLVAVDLEYEKCTVDSRFIYFEALNLQSAIKRVKKYKEGKIELFNLRKPSKEGIKFY